MDTQPDVQTPAGPLAPVLQVKIACSCLSWLHSLKIRSLRESRGDSLRLSAHHGGAAPGRRGGQPQDGAALDASHGTEVTGATEKIPFLSGPAGRSAQPPGAPVSG